MALPLTLGTQFQTDTLNWIEEMVDAGERTLKAEPAYTEIASNIAYVMGDQLSRRPQALSNVRDNRLKKIILESVSALTDIHPLFGFQSFNPAFQNQVVILDKLTRAWWVNTYADLRLADVVRYAMTAGVGYAEVVWDESLNGGKGDVVLVPTDPRDVLPIAPKFDISLQGWGGVIIRSMETVENLQQRYGIAAAGLTPDRGATTFTNKVWTAIKGMVQSPNRTGPALGRTAHNIPQQVPAKELRKVYYRDYRLWAGDAPITMGEHGKSWSYTVYPVGYIKKDGTPATEEDARLYPRGRLLVATRDRVLYDGPNPYWHGMFPIAKLSLDPWPWSLLGGSVVSDIKPLQDSLNDTVNGFLDHVKVCLRPLVVGDKNMPKREWEKLDPRLPGQKIMENPSVGKGIRIEPPPPLPNDVPKWVEWNTNEMDYLSGVANLQSLLQLRQAPGADSVEALQEALTPLLRLKGRLLEVFLREVGEMTKSNFFQFYTAGRRVAMLGEAGLDFVDFDFDPGTLVPALMPSDPGYAASLDFRLTRDERARIHHQNFTFQITPNSLLAISQLSRKLTFMRLRQMGLVDKWTLWESLEIPNAGTPPNGAETIDERLQAEMLQTAQMQMMGAAMMDPSMLMAGAMLGGTGNQGAGRPPTFSGASKLQEKPGEDGVPRVTQSESASS